MIWDMKEQAVCFVCFGLQCEKSLNRFDKMKETQEMWEILKSDKYQVLISELVLEEISECKEDKKEALEKIVDKEMV